MRDEILPLDIPAFEFALLALVEMEHTFLVYKLALDKNVPGLSAGKSSNSMYNVPPLLLHMTLLYALAVL